MATGYTYRPLQDPNNEIRLLTISQSPLQDDELLEFRLEHVPFAEESPSPGYYAVSYFWGDSAYRKDLVIDGTTVSVPVNTENALRDIHRALMTSGPESLQSKGLVSLPQPWSVRLWRRLVSLRQTESVRLWIDAMCINQSDVAERGHQVALMQRVYSRAQSGLVWLGKGDESTANAIKELTALHEECSQATNGFQDFRSTLYEKKESFYYKKTEIAPLHVKDWQSLVSFFNSPWFERLWVVQETVLPKSVFCVKGPYSIPWEVIGFAALWLNYRDFWLNFSDETILEPAVHKAQIIHQNRLFGSSFTSLLQDVHRYKTRDPRDKVYGILGMASSSEGNSGALDDLLPPDYGSRVLQIYSTATRLTMRTSKRLEILCYAEILRESPAPAADNEWPSWIPRFDLPGQWGSGPFPMYLVGVPGADNRLSACLAERQPDHGILKLQGVVCSRVRHCMAVPYTNEVRKDWIRAAWDFVTTHAPDKLSALPRTVVLNGATRSFESMNISTRWPAFADWCHGKNQGGEREQMDFRDAIFASARNRHLCSIDDGCIGMTPRGTEEGDHICILFGGAAPFVLRETPPGSDSWILIGDIYVDGIMEGEYIRRLQDEGRLESETRWFEIH